MTGTGMLPNGSAVVMPSPEQYALSMDVPVVRDATFGTPRFVGLRSGFLSPSAPDAPSEAVLRAFLEANGRKFTLHASDVLDPENAEKMRDVVTPHNGMRSLTWRQQHNGIEIFGAHLALNLTADNRIINVQSRALHVPSLRFHDAVKVTAGDAEEIAGRSLNTQHPTSNIQRPTEAIWYPLDMITVAKAWDVLVEGKANAQHPTPNIQQPSVDETHRVIVRADTGEIVEDINLTYGLEEASYRIYTGDSPLPMTPGPDAPTNFTPTEVSRELVTLAAWSTNASPNGWIPAGANTLAGNNASVYADRDGNDARDDPAVTGTTYRVFDYACDLIEFPETYQEQSQIQAFYWVNLFHDRMYDLGFDEAAGNFQNDNFGRGGQQGDALVVEVQNGGDLGFPEANKAWYSGWGDGSRGAVYLNIFGRSTPHRCSALDAIVLVHEMTHGLTSRLIGNGFGLTTTQSRGLAEGWSDFMALSMVAETNDVPDGCYAIGTYAGIYDDVTPYYGIRRFPYSTDTNKAPQTLADIDPNQQDFDPAIPRNPEFGSADADNIYNIGEVWCLVLWECRANLIERYGFAGNELMMGLIVDGLKLAPENPNLTEARDSILQADLVNHGGTNQVDLWRGFAKRGLGYGAVVPGSVATVGIEESFVLPFGVAVTVMEVTGDGDGYLEPGEGGEIEAVLTSHEMGLSNAVGVLVFDQEKTEGTEEVLVTSSNTVFGSVIASVASTSAPPFAVDVAGDFPGNSNAWFTVEITSDQGVFSLPVAVRIGNPLDYPPEIDAVTIEPGVTNAVVSWQTGIEATGGVNYRLTTEITENTKNSQGLGTNHTTTLNGLLSGSNYVCRIIAVGTNGLTNTTAEIGFRTHSYVHVYADSTEAPELGTLDAPFKSLQAAANAAKLTGDNIRVAMGVYTSAQVEAVLDLEGSDWALTMEGGYSPDFTERDPEFWQTVIDGQWARRGIRLDEGAKLEISGVTITRGSGEWGGGVHVRMSTFSATDCVISDNASTNGVNNLGGGIYGTLGSKLTLNSCVISSNRADFGGGVFGTSADTFISLSRSLLRSNLGILTTGGVELELAANALLSDCEILSNSGTHKGGGITLLPFCEAAILNTTIAHNHATGGSSPSSDGGGGISIAGNSSTAVLVLKDSIVFGNRSPFGDDLRCAPQSEVHIIDSNIGDIYGTLTTSNNVINADPLFADPENGDFHLRYGSPCIDAGSTNAGANVDIDGEPRPFGAAMDMGADEFVDADGDNMADYWEKRKYGDTATTDGTEDTDGDGLDTFGEYIQQTNPHDADTDADLATDGWEVANGYDPKDRDMDGDGMWDGWEVNYGLNALTNDASLNPDGDPHNNFNEFLADTDPHDNSSVLELLSVGRQWGGLRLDWKGGRYSYQFLESCSTLTSNDWHTVLVVPPPTPTSNAVIVFDEESRLFYRIRAARE